MELLNSIFHFFTDKTKKLPHKVILCLLALVFIALLDNFLSFSFSYNNGNKIEQIEGINKILSDTTLTKSEKNKLLILRKNIVNHSTWKDKTYDFLTSIEFKNDVKANTKKTVVKPNVIVSEQQIEKINKTQSKTRNYFWHFVSSSWPFLLLMIVFPIVGFFDKKTPFWQAIGIVIIIEPFFYGFSWIYAKVFSFIPIIFNDPFYNYILNTILCLLSIFVFTLFEKKNN